MTDNKLEYHRNLAEKYEKEGNDAAAKFHRKAVKSYSSAPKTNAQKKQEPIPTSDLWWIAKSNRLKSEHEQDHWKNKK